MRQRKVFISTLNIKQESIKTDELMTYKKTIKQVKDKHEEGIDKRGT